MKNKIDHTEQILEKISGSVFCLVRIKMVDSVFDRIKCILQDTITEMDFVMIKIR